MLRSALATKERYKSEITKKPKHDTTKRKKTMLRTIRTVGGDRFGIKVEDLTSKVAIPSENYWEVLAERRRTALRDALQKNTKLFDLVGILDKENCVYKEMWNEGRSVVTLLHDMLEED